MTPLFFEFLTSLASNNNKEWFDLNRKTYEKEVKIPFEEFAIELGKSMCEWDTELARDFKKGIFRINKDIRFAKDKTPYKTNRSVAFSKNGKNDVADPGYYIELSPEKCFIAGGAWNPNPIDLKKIRKELFYNTQEFVDIVENPTFQKELGGLHGQQAKRLDKEATLWLEDSKYIAFKQFYFFIEFNSAECLKPNFVEFVNKKFKKGFEFNQFLRKAIRDVE